MKQKLKQTLAAMMVTAQMFASAVKVVHEQLSHWTMDEDEAVDDISTTGKAFIQTVQYINDVPSQFKEINDILDVAQKGVIRHKMEECVKDIIEELMKQKEDEEDAELD